MTTTVTPRIYVACLAAYNNGILHGKWLDVDGDADDLWAGINEVLKTSPIPGAEEWAIHDFEGFGEWRLSEYESVDHIVVAAALIEEHGEAGAAFIANDPSVLSTYDADALRDAFDESYAGTWESEKAFVEDLVGEVGLPGIGTVYTGGYGSEPVDLVDAIGSYLDWDKLTRDVMMDHWAAKLSDYTVAVFRSY